MQEIVVKLHSIGVIKFGNKEIARDFFSPLYVDMNPLLFHPKIALELLEVLKEKVGHLKFDQICGTLPFGNYLATPLSLFLDSPLLLPNLGNKPTGLKFTGSFKSGGHCLLMNDVLTFGQSILDFIDTLEEEGIVVKEVFSLIDFNIGGKKKLKSRGIVSHHLFKLEEILEQLMEEEKMGAEQYKLSMDFLQNEQ